MSATEIGSAYVTIMPSTKGIKQKLTSEIGGSGAFEESGTQGGIKLGKGLIKAFAASGAVAAAGKLLKDSISEGAQLEQSIGGIETMFKSSADQMKQYANEAYKTSGVSANEYMQQVTSFSASMISSLGGDTSKAAALSNQAMVDMSDNANKFGTDIENIQNAYQGFAKQNYTMLDNLKLGYGGTKSEMERLLTDAEKLTGKSYDVSNFADITEAIHAIQTEMDITGTTSKEASETISGSVGMMKAAWKDWLANMALGSDMSEPSAKLIESFGSMAKNMAPAALNVVKGFGQGIIAALPSLSTAMLQLSDKLVTSLENGDIAKSGSAFMGKLLKAIKDNFPSLFNGCVQLATSLVATVAEFVLSAAVKAVASLGKAILSGVKAAASAYISPFVNATRKVITSFMNAKNKIFSIFNAIKKKLKEKLNFSWGNLTKKFTDAKDKIISAFKKIKDKLKETLTIKLGKIKLPHFKISGSFDIKKKQVPGLSIDWYKGGGIFNDPTVIGVGDSKAPEAVIPIDMLQEYIRDAMNGGGDTWNVTVNVSGAEDPEEWAAKFAKTLKRQARMGA